MAKVKVTREQKKLLKAIRKNPHDPTPLTELGWIYFEQRNYDEARQYFSHAVKTQRQTPAAADAVYGLALIDMENKQYGQAREALRSLIREFPDFQKRPEVHFTLAKTNDILWRTTEWNTEQEQRDSEYLQRAIDHYEQAVERRSERHETASVLLGKLFYDIQRYDDALHFLQRVSQAPGLDSNDAFYVNYLLGKLNLETKHDLPAAKTSFEAALKQGAKHTYLADIHKQLGDIHKTLGNDEPAIQCYEKSLACSQEEQSESILQVLLNLSELNYRHNWLQKAIDYAERGVQTPSESVTISRQLLEILAKSSAGIQNYEKAAEYELRYLKLAKDPTQKAASYLRLGIVYERQEKTKEAADAYRKGLKFAKRNLESSKLHAAVGRIYLHEDRLNQAMNHLKEAAEFAEQDAAHSAFVYRLLGECYHKRQETELAIEAYGTVLAKYAESDEEPFARQELKNFRKQLKKDIQEIERAQRSEDVEQQLKAGDIDELERLLGIIEDILDEKGFFERLKEGLAKTHLSFVSKIEALLAGRTSVDDELIENLEEVLILSDIGVSTTQRIIENLQEQVERKLLQEPSQITHYLKREVQSILEGHESRIDINRAAPFFILVIGVNGTGKTTTIGKLSSQFAAQGKKVLLVAGDTFRAAAIEQLEIWGERTGCDVIKHASGSDPSAVMYDAVQAARSRNIDVVIADTAGRLHTQKNLMEELRKMVRVISREMPGAPHEILLVIDATTGQNAISQAQLFHEGIGITGFVLTKLDGTAKGGIIVGISNDMDIPVRYIGIGEQVEDLREFHGKEFVEALFED